MARLSRLVAVGMATGSFFCAGAGATDDGGTVKPHIVMHLVDDWGWANAGWHRLGSRATDEVLTPNMDALVRRGIELDRAYSYKMCSPSRCSLQSGRLPTHVNILNNAATAWNPTNNDTGFSGMPRSMTGLAQVMKRGGYSTHQVGKVPTLHLPWLLLPTA
eukprot:COSAG01_NODE_5236_length_4393_cov_2.037727_4_plen_161_part_00